MSSLPKTLFTPEEYLELERNSETKSEYFNGEIFAMSGGSLNHALIATNVSSELRTQLKKLPCTLYSADLRIKVGSSSLYTYPDIVVVCGEPEISDEDKDTVT